jgi:hypothetical protein
VLAKFRNVYEKMHSALDGMPYAELAISDEVKEQVRPLQVCKCTPADPCQTKLKDTTRMA